MNEQIDKAFWGYARWDITSNAPITLKFGLVNNRPVVKPWVVRLAASITREGARRCAQDTMIPVMIPKALLNSDKKNQTFSTDLSSYSALDHIFTTVPTEVKVLGGQHRREAMKRIVKNAVDKLQGDVAMTQLKDLIERVHEMQRAQHGKVSGSRLQKEAKRLLIEAQVEVERKEREIERMVTMKEHKGMWLIAVYIEGE